MGVRISRNMPPLNLEKGYLRAGAVTAIVGAAMAFTWITADTMAGITNAQQQLLTALQAHEEEAERRFLLLEMRTGDRWTRSRMTQWCRETEALNAENFVCGSTEYNGPLN